MKNNFINSIMLELIKNKGYLPFFNENKQIYLRTGINFLVKKSPDSFAMMELIDGDLFTTEEIKKKLGENIDKIQNLKESNVHFIFSVFFFDEKPPQDKLEAIELKQFYLPDEKKFVNPITISLSEQNITNYFPKSLPDFGLNKLINSQFEKKTLPVTTSDVEEEAKKIIADSIINIKVNTPYVTYGLTAINIVIFSLILLYQFYFNIPLSSFFANVDSGLLTFFGTKLNYLIINHHEYWRFITPIFLHWSIPHLFFNCLSLYFVGVSVERIYGHMRFFCIYFIAGIMGNILSFTLTNGNGAGASGAIFGLLGALLFFGAENPKVFKRTFGSSIILITVINLVYGFSTSGIDNYAHIGGLIGGFLSTSAVNFTNAKNKWYLNRYIAIIVMIIMAILLLYLGFTRVYPTNIY